MPPLFFGFWALLNWHQAKLREQPWLTSSIQTNSLFSILSLFLLWRARRWVNSLSRFLEPVGCLEQMQKVESSGFRWSLRTLRCREAEVFRVGSTCVAVLLHHTTFPFVQNTAAGILVLRTGANNGCRLHLRSFYYNVVLRLQCWQITPIMYLVILLRFPKTGHRNEVLKTCPELFSLSTQNSPLSHAPNKPLLRLTPMVAFDIKPKLPTKYLVNAWADLG